MGKFSIGQRCRITSCRRSENRKFVGKQAVVVEVFWNDIIREWQYGLDISPAENFRFLGVNCNRGWSEDQLEPMCPPHEACDDAELIASLDKLAQRVGELA